MLLKHTGNTFLKKSSVGSEEIKRNTMSQLDTADRRELLGSVRRGGPRNGEIGPEKRSARFEQLFPQPSIEKHDEELAYTIYTQYWVLLRPWHRARRWQIERAEKSNMQVP